MRKVLKELEAIGLIYRKRNGRGKANYIYVMDYMVLYRREQVAKEGATASIQNFDNRKCNKTNQKNTDYSNLPHRKRFRNSFLNFQQRDYDFDELERLLLANLVTEKTAEENN